MTREHRAWKMLIRRLNYLNSFDGNRSEMEKTTRIVAEIWDDTGHDELGGVMEKTELESELLNAQEHIDNLEFLLKQKNELISQLKAKAEAYDRLMSGGKKTLKEWANTLGKPVAVDIENRLCWFPKKPEIGLATWIWYDEQFGCFGEYLPKNLIDFNGDWKESLTLPDGWEATDD
jgi:hypothetical protein